MPLASITNLSLFNYRNLSSFNLKPYSSGVLIIGDNGAGKTNILEAISMMSPGRGLRGARLEEICKNEEESWKINATLISALGLASLENSYDKGVNKRIIEFNGSKIANSELAKFLSIIWLTPQMDGIFLGPASDRRKYLDRIVYAFKPAHAKIVSQYESYLKERMHILQSPNIDYTWLTALERNLSSAAKLISESRLEALEILRASLNELKSPFPKASLGMSHEYKDEEWIGQQFKGAREQDARSGRSSFGPHKADFLVYYENKNIPARLCSTGEQKAMLISITIALILAVTKERQISPIVLLDEIFVHLDDSRREYLAEFLAEEQSQVWITGTEHDITKYFKEYQVVLI